MKLIPKNDSLLTRFSAHRLTVLAWLALLLSLSIAFGAVILAKEDAAENDGTDRLTETTASPSDADPEQILVSGNGSYLVYLKVDGEEYVNCVDRNSDDTVLDLLYLNGVYLNEEDQINCDLDQELEPDLSVEVGRVTYKEVTERESIPYETTRIMMTFTLSPAMKKTYASRLKNTAGVPGIREVTTRVKLVDGVEVSRTTLSSQVITKPKDAVVYVDASYLLDLGNGAPSSALEVLDFRFTAYTYTSVGGVYTATGTKTKVGYVAVDPKVIPLHSYLYIVLDNGFVYGYCYAKDTGGAIKGNIVDVFLPSETDCYYFGRRTGKVYVLSYGS